MFQVKDRMITSVEPFVHLPVTEGEIYAVGEALVMQEKATKCGETERPTHICMGTGDGKTLPAMPVLDTTRFEVPYTALPAVGATVTLALDGLQVTATDGGTFTIVSVDTEAHTVTGYFK